jgi:hypothetical protein
MAQAKVMNGSRAKMAINGKVVGLFTSCSYGVALDANPVYIMGAHAPVEIGLTGQEAISVTATGWRVVDSGPHALTSEGSAASVPKLQELLTHNDITLSILDRLTGKEIMTVTGVRPTGYSTTINSRGLQDLTVNFLGLRIADESGGQNESKGSAAENF